MCASAPGGAGAQGRLLFWFVCLCGAGEWTHRSPARAWETQSNLWHLTPVLSLLMAEGWGSRCQHEAQPNRLPMGFQLGDGRKWIIECNSFFFFRALAKKKKNLCVYLGRCGVSGAMFDWLNVLIHFFPPPPACSTAEISTPASAVTFPHWLICCKAF